MGCPAINLAVKYAIEAGLKELRARPDLYLPNIFDTINTGTLSTLFGAPYLDSIKNWLQKTDIPVVLGWGVDYTKLPSVSVALGSAQPVQGFIGDRGLDLNLPVQQYERDILVQGFQPASLTFSADNSYVLFTLPTTMPDSQATLFTAGLSVRDAQKHEYTLSVDAATQSLRLDAITGGPTVRQIDASSLDLISPYSDAIYQTGVMQYQHNTVIGIWSMSDRQDGEWMWMIVMDILLRYRPILTELFGVDLAFSSAGDPQIDTSKLPQKTWFRPITLQSQATWTWIGNKQTDLLAFTSYVQAQQAENTDASQTVTLPPSK